MKNNKTTRIEGFHSEFFKMFWSKLKLLILRVVNYCYSKGKLSTTYWRIFAFNIRFDGIYRKKKDQGVIDVDRF